ncbi:hypothetical protein BMS3Abin05_01814 [bacterium BMS3Abin05]|nr:hypothetical protein BMS3Abin05_01814 [bacterium BMS3Abin05]
MMAPPYSLNISVLLSMPGVVFISSRVVFWRVDVISGCTIGCFAMTTKFGNCIAFELSWKLIRVVKSTATRTFSTVIP